MPSGCHYKLEWVQSGHCCRKVLNGLLAEQCFCSENISNVDQIKSEMSVIPRVTGYPIYIILRECVMNLVTSWLVVLCSKI